MDAALTKLRAWPVWKRLQRLPISAVCEDNATAARVEEFCRELSLDLGDSCQLITEQWPLSELRLPQLRAIAAQEAAQAGLIIISVHHGQSLPEEMKNWIQLWLRRKGGGATALLALFDPLYEGDSSAMAGYLKRVAETAHMEFVAKTDERQQIDQTD